MAKTLANEPPASRRTSRRFSAQTARPVRLATRYSRFVFLMKYLLPVIACILVAMVVMWPEVESVKDTFRLGLSGITGFESGAGQRIAKARYTGRNSQNLPFTITADRAVQPETAGAPVRLEKPKADITLADGAWLALSAAHGNFDKEHQQLALDGGVDLFHDAGMEFHTPDAIVDIEAGTAHGTNGAKGQGPIGRITGEGFRILDHGKRILFTGRSRLVLHGNGKGSGR